MSRPIKPARLWLEPARRRENGTIRPAVWVILDRGSKRSTGCPAADRVGAEAAFERYLATKRLGEIIEPDRGTDPAETFIADCLTLYALEKIKPRLTPQRTREFEAKVANLGRHLGTLTLTQIDAAVCAQYSRDRRANAAARRELEDLRAAIAYYCKRKRIPNPAEIVLPERGDARDRWLSRREAARLLWAAWRMRQSWKGQPSDRATGKHVARFILVALYTGTRAGAICAAGFERAIGRAYIDLDAGIFYRAALGARKTNKRQPPVHLPPRLLAHIRRWHHLGIAKSAVVEWNGKQVQRINKAFRSARALARLDTGVVPHTLRHTCGTWIASSGTASRDDAAAYLGVSRDVFDRVYGHHCPDYQEAAVASFLFKRVANDCERNPVNKRAQTGDKIAKDR
jgi:integrase